MNAHVTGPQLSLRGEGLSRPECLVAHESGLLFASDWLGSGGVAIIRQDGAVARITARRGADDPLRPNGIALEAGGSFLVAHLGADTGGLYRLHADGGVEPVLLDVDGTPLPPSNFPLVDRAGRIWLTTSTRVRPRADDYRPGAATGFVVLIDKNGARVVADGLGYANECALDASETTLFVNETFARRLTRFSIGPDGSLSDRTTVARFGPGTFPDGIAVDVDGCLWITSIVSNRVIRVTPDGRQSVILEESDPHHLAHVEDAFQSGTMGRPHLDGSPATTLRNISSLTFGGAGLSTAYLGCLLGDRIVSFDPGTRAPPHPTYHADLGPIAQHRIAS